MRRKLILVAIVGALAVALAAPAMAAPDKATCAGIVGVVHGHHVVGDYVDGSGHDVLGWPPAGQVDASGGAALPGGPGPGFHFPNGVAPGASFCNPQSNSPGFHLGD